MFKSSNMFDSLTVSDLVWKPDCSEGCNRCNCKICKNECSFLKRYGNPGQIALLCQEDPDKWLPIAFECSLCGLCSSVCPRKSDPAAMFLDFRRQLVQKGCVDFSKYKSLLNYERKGTSKKYSLYHLPENCTTVFFPGCSLTGTRPQSTFKAYEYLKKQNKTIGIVLDCCTKPSHDLGRQDYFGKMFSQIESFLLDNGVKTIVVACPNCYKIFDAYGKKFRIETVYEVMSRCGIESSTLISEKITIHDPCPTRLQKNVQNSVRNIVTMQGLEIVETPHQKNKTYCCGEGGAVGCVNPGYAQDWTQKRVDENQGRLIATYCAGCVSMLSKKAQTFHILDLIFDPKRTLAGKVPVSKAPFTYLNRLNLKRKLKKLPAAIVKERRSDADPLPKKQIAVKKHIIGLVAFVIKIFRKRNN